MLNCRCYIQKPILFFWAEKDSDKAKDGHNGDSVLKDIDMEAKADIFGGSKAVCVKFAGHLDLFKANFENLKN